MAERGLTALLNAHHDKLNKHTSQLSHIEHQLTGLEQSVAALEHKIANEDESSGLRAGLRDWIENIKELM